MNIARIVSSNSHIDYVGRIIDELDANDPPSPEDYGFGQFVSLPLKDGPRIVGIIYNSMLVNPEYANYGPRLSPRPETGNFTPDFIAEQGTLVGILVLGAMDADSKISHGVPRRTVPAGQEVERLNDADILAFHRGADDAVQVHYFSQVTGHAGLFAVPLLESIIGQLSPGCAEADRQRLEVLKQTLGWQRTMGGMRL